MKFKSVSVAISDKSLAASHQGIEKHFSLDMSGVRGPQSQLQVWIIRAALKGRNAGAHQTNYLGWAIDVLYWTQILDASVPAQVENHYVR